MRRTEEEEDDEVAKTAAVTEAAVAAAAAKELEVHPSMRPTQPALTVAVESKLSALASVQP